MTTQYLAADIEAEEGRRRTAYADPLTGGAPWTIGVGHTGPEVHPGLVIDDAQINADLAHDIDAATHKLDRDLPWWRKLTDERQDVLVQMAFQIGEDGVLKFHHTLADIEAGHYDMAAADMHDSAWARQTPGRVDRLAQQMRTSVRSHA